MVHSVERAEDGKIHHRNAEKHQQLVVVVHVLILTCLQDLTHASLCVVYIYMFCKPFVYLYILLAFHDAATVCFVDNGPVVSCDHCCHNAQQLGGD